MHALNANLFNAKFKVVDQRISKNEKKLEKLTGIENKYFDPRFKSNS